MEGKSEGEEGGKEKNVSSMRQHLSLQTSDLSQSCPDEKATATSKQGNFIVTFQGTRCKDSTYNIYTANLLRFQSEINTG